MPKPFALSLSQAISASDRLRGHLVEATATAEGSPLVSHREAASLLRSLLPHVFRMQELLRQVETSTARPNRRSLQGD